MKNGTIYKIGIVTLAFMASIAVQAQFSYDYLRNADKYYAKGDYFTAAQYYEKYLQANKKKGNEGGYEPYSAQSLNKVVGKASNSREKVVYKLAESYRKYNDFGNAEKWYAEAAKFDTAQFPQARYWHAVSLRANGKYDEARAAFQTFTQSYTRKDDFAVKAKKELDNLIFIDAQMKKSDLGMYVIGKADSTVNPVGANYAPVAVNGVLYFTSTRPDSADSKGKAQYVNHLYQASLKDTSIGVPEKVAILQPLGTQQGVSAVSADGKKMYLTRWTVKDGKKNAALYISTKNGDGVWSEPVMLDTLINRPGYSTQQPAVTPDGKYLLFSSDAPGGAGKFDLYYVALDSKGLPKGKINNLKSINTPDDDQAPFYHGASSTLVFASNGRVGMGGFDLYQAKGSIESLGAVENLGYPVNSVKDDIYFYSGSDRNIWKGGYFSSDRGSVCCLELYSMHKLRPARYITGAVYDSSTNQPTAATINVVDGNGKTVYTFNTGADGRYAFTMPEYQSLKLEASKPSYYNGSINFNAPADPESDSLFNPNVYISPIPVETKSQPMIVYFDFDKKDLRPSDINTLDSLAALLQREPSLSIELGGHTDGKGGESYNKRLSKKRAVEVKDYLVKQGIAADRLETKGYGKCCPIVAETTADGADNPEARQQNRRVEVKIIKL
ncbi:MAG: OmpA family protein [Chitinophagaceae bacterium]